MGCETPSEVEWKEELYLTDTTLLTDKGFARVFARSFDTLQYDYRKPHDINPIIEALEGGTTKGSRFIRRLDYDEDGWCAEEIETPVCKAFFSEDDVEFSLDDRADQGVRQGHRTAREDSKDCAPPDVTLALVERFQES